MPKPFVQRDASPEELRENILSTYLSLRVGIAVLGIAFPWILLIGGRYWAHLCLQHSMSAYYHATVFDGRLMRNEFVGLLFAVGVFLYLYKGYSPAENYALNAAGGLAVGIALFPMPWTACDLRICNGAPGIPSMPCSEPKFSIHGFCAITFFLCIAFVCLFCADNTLTLIPDHKLRKRFKAAYKAVGLAMIGSIIGAYVLNTAIHTGQKAFWVETAGITSFGAYWLTKTVELKMSAAEPKALRGQLARIKGYVVDVSSPAPENKVLHP